jgi:hypothetical protein
MTAAPWPKTTATVTECHYEFNAGPALACGISTSKHYLITYTYWVQGQQHSGQLKSDKPIPQGELFPIAYNPETPADHTHSTSTTKQRSPLIAFALAGSVALSLVWLILLRTCH